MSFFWVCGACIKTEISVRGFEMYKSLRRFENGLLGRDAAGLVDAKWKKMGERGKDL